MANGPIPYAQLPGKGKHLPPTLSAIASPPVQNQYGAPAWQVNGIFTTLVKLQFPNLSAGQSQQIASPNVPVNAGWPSPAVLKPTDQGMVGIAIAPVQLAPIGTILGSIAYGLSWNSANAPANTATTSTLILQPGFTYSGPYINFSVDMYCVTTIVNPFYLEFNVQAVLYGISTLGTAL